jgi:hypothetical protein
MDSILHKCFMKLWNTWDTPENKSHIRWMDYECVTWMVPY